MLRLLDLVFEPIEFLVERRVPLYAGLLLLAVMFVRCELAKVKELRRARSEFWSFGLRSTPTHHYGYEFGLSAGEPVKPGDDGHRVADLSAPERERHEWIERERQLWPAKSLAELCLWSALVLHFGRGIRWMRSRLDNERRSTNWHRVFGAAMWVAPWTLMLLPALYGYGAPFYARAPEGEFPMRFDFSKLAGDTVSYRRFVELACLLPATVIWFVANVLSLSLGQGCMPMETDLAMGILLRDPFILWGAGLAVFGFAGVKLEEQFLILRQARRDRNRWWRSADCSLG